MSDQEQLNSVEEKQQLVTEVTSIAKEEAKTGQHIPIPTEEELVQKANSSFIVNRKRFADIFATLSSKQKNRVANSILDLPQDGLPVYLKENKEKLAFAIGQRVIADRFIITTHFINEERRKFIKAKIEVEQNKAQSENKEGETNNE